MNKQQFLKELEKSLSGLPQKDIDERIEFYSESIDDRVEEGKTEEEAIKDIGSVDEVVNQIITETPLTKIVKNKCTPKSKPSGFAILLLILGFPLWLPLLLVLGVLLVVGYMLLWILVIVSYTVEAAVLTYGVVGAYATLTTLGTDAFNLRYLAVALMGIGFAFIFFFVCIKATKINLKITKNILLGIKKKIIRGGNQDAQA